MCRYIYVNHPSLVQRIPAIWFDLQFVVHVRKKLQHACTGLGCTEDMHKSTHTFHAISTSYTSPQSISHTCQAEPVTCMTPTTEASHQKETAANEATVKTHTYIHPTIPAANLHYTCAVHPLKQIWFPTQARTGRACINVGHMCDTQLSPN